IPSWASTMGQNQALSVCSTSVQFGTADSKWCGEFSGYTLDQLSGKTTVTFVDHTGYIPSWASTMGQNQALSVCSTSVQFGTADSKWCGEFSGYILDQLSKTTSNTSSQQSTVPEFGPIAGIVITLSLIGSIVISKRFSVFNRH
ncbi:MAG: hypothetical protein WAN47_02830, partial [Nitrosotalea sp.]